MGNSYDQLFKQGGQKNIQIDYTSFKPKLFYDDSASQQQILKQMKFIQEKQKQIKKYKYYQDFDRTYYSSNQTIFRKQQKIENFFYLSIITSLYTSYIFGKYGYASYTSRIIAWKLMPRVFAFTSFLFFVNYFMDDCSKVQNEDIFFRNLEGEIRIYVDFDQKLDLYKYVDDIKYSFKYPTHQEYNKVKSNINHNRMKNYEQAVFKMWRERYGAKKKDIVENQK